MRVLLIEPPQADPAQPYSSLAVLLSAWRGSGLDVEVEDLNVDFFNYLCKGETIRRHLEIVERRLAVDFYRDDKERQALQSAATFGESILDGVPVALKVLRDKELFYDPSMYAWALRLLSRALEVLSAPFYPGRVTLQSFKTAHSYLSSKGILAAAEDEGSNLFIPYWEVAGADKVLAHRPDVVAVSVTFQTQIIPAWTLARKIKSLLPGVKVVLGGATISRIREGLQQSPELFRDVDSFVLFEGETAFPALLDEWERGGQGLGAPNVMLQTARGIETSAKTHSEDMNLLKAPDHRGLPLRDYWWPEPALLINSSRGCYYGRCAFCMISPATWGPERMGQSYRSRSTDKVVADLLFAHQQTGALSFNLANDILPPRALEEIGEALVAERLPITWDSEIRLERGLSRRVLTRMAEGGCRHLRFGFETASPRVAKLMDKGTDMQATDRILSDCRDLGITVSLLCQVAFPGETREEAYQTLRFLQSANDRVSCVSLTQFALERGSKVFQNPAKFGVSLFPIPETEDLSWVYRYTHLDGTDTDAGVFRYEEIEAALDRSYPDRDLFFKGGLGHAHTSLYTRHYSAQQFLAWNLEPRRSGGHLEAHQRLRLPKGLMVRQDGNSPQTWSKFTICSLEVPELLASIDGTGLLVLVAASGKCLPTDLVNWIQYLSDGQYSAVEAAEFVASFSEAGLLLNADNDARSVALL